MTAYIQGNPINLHPWTAYIQGNPTDLISKIHNRLHGQTVLLPVDPYRQSSKGCTGGGGGSCFPAREYAAKGEMVNPAWLVTPLNNCMLEN